MDGRVEELELYFRIYSDLLWPFQDLQETFLGLQRRSLLGPDNLFPISPFFSRFNSLVWQTSTLPTDFYLASFHTSLHASNYIFFFLSIGLVSWKYLPIGGVSWKYISQLGEYLENWVSILKVPQPHLASSSQMALLPIWPTKWEKEFLQLFSQISQRIAFTNENNSFHFPSKKPLWEMLFTLAG